ncbi:MAG: thioredoxin-disulfide reductase [Deltaproteobacteria bacterium]|nr:thioredoxin-disulfide reductase [Candidatus Zymogenaceae bacterium]
MTTSQYDILIIGAGPAGLTAGLYASRGGMKTILLEKMAPGGQAATTDVIENYPGYPEGVSGPALMESMENQARRFGAEIVTITEVTRIIPENDFFTVETSGDAYTAKSVIVASGAEPKRLGIPGEGKFTGRGVSYCAVCDGAFFRDTDIAVVGGGNAAVEEALYLTRYGKKIYLIHRRDRLRADRVLAERAFRDEKIEIVWDTVVDEIKGEGGVSELAIRNVKNNAVSALMVEGVFIYVGFQSNTSYLGDLVDYDDNGFIITTPDMATSNPGIFACGDVRSKKLRQVVTAAGDGSIAAFSAEKHIEKLENREYGEFSAP